MIWLVALVVPLVGAPLFFKVYGRRLDALTGPPDHEGGGAP